MHLTTGPVGGGAVTAPEAQAVARSAALLPLGVTRLQDKSGTGSPKLARLVAVYGAGVRPTSDLRLAAGTCAHRPFVSSLGSDPGARRSLHAQAPPGSDASADLELDPSSRRTADPPSSSSSWCWHTLELPVGSSVQSMPSPGSASARLASAGLQLIQRASRTVVHEHGDFASMDPVAVSWIKATATMERSVAPPESLLPASDGATIRPRLCRGSLAIMAEHALKGSAVSAVLRTCHERWLASIAAKGAMYGSTLDSAGRLSLLRSLWEPSFEGVMTPVCDLPVRQSPATDAKNLARAHAASRLYPVATLGDWMLVAWPQSDEVAGRVRVMEPTGGVRREAVMQQLLEEVVAESGGQKKPSVAPATTLLQGVEIEGADQREGLLAPVPLGLSK